MEPGRLPPGKKGSCSWGKKCVSLGLAQRTKQRWWFSSSCTMLESSQGEAGIRLDLKSNESEGTVAGEVPPREWTYRNLGHQTNSQMPICNSQSGVLVTALSLPFFTRKGTLSGCSQHRTDSHRGSDLNSLPFPQLFQLSPCSVPSGLSLIGVFVFSLIASQPSMLLLKAELPSGIGLVCPYLPSLPALQVLPRTTCAS